MPSAVVARRGLAALAFAVVVVMVPAYAASDALVFGVVDRGQIERSAAFVALRSRLLREEREVEERYAQEAAKVPTQRDREVYHDQVVQQWQIRQRQLLVPFEERVTQIVRMIANRRGFAAVIDRRIVLVGGVDITAAVLDRLAQPAITSHETIIRPPQQAIRVGVVDTARVDMYPALQRAREQCIARQQRIEEQGAPQLRMQDSMNNEQRRALADRLLHDMDQVQRETVEPVMEHIRTVMRREADRKGFMLVLPRESVLVGGRDMTSDVLAAL